VLQPAATASVLSYRLRVNSSGGPETTITLPGGNILRLTGNGTSAAWVAWEGSFRQLASSGIVAGQLDFTVVTLVTSATSVTLFENGVFKYRRGYGPPVTTWAPGIAVQHRGSGTAVSVDLGGIRVLPSIKPAMLLAMDLQPRLLAYFPLKTDLDNASGNGGTLTAVGGSPSFGPGRFGHAAIFTPRGPALAIPPLSRAVSASYTISAWVKVNAYPADGSTAGIAGFLLLGSDGKLDYRFLYNLDRVYRGVRVPSRQRVSAGTWHNIVVTYSYEEARLAIFIDGNLDTLSYLGADVASASAIIPAAGYVGGYRETFNSPIVGLDGAVGDVVFLSQHVHQPTAAMLANVNAAVTDGPELPVLIPLFLILMAGVVRVGIEEAILRQVQPAPPPSLEELVRRIRSRVGVPARQGARVSRADLGINDDYPILLDIGGEGPLDVGGLVTGFSGAININALMTGTGTPVVTVAFGESRGAPIPLLVQLAAWDTDPHPRYPFTDKFADQITMIGSPLLDVHVAEMARVIKVGGEINLWVDKSWGANVERLAQALNSQVETPEDIPRFANNGVPENQEGGTWYVRKRIIARR
jgi:concanavalin A-like lectin/glucanase superfamily protein